MVNAMHPFTPYHPISIFGHQDIAACQERIYYFTVRLRAILLDRLDESRDEQRLHHWNSYFALELVGHSPDYFRLAP